MEADNTPPFSALKTSRKYHKWLMLFVGSQFVIWSVTGAYMVFFDIDYIHGDTLVKNHQTKVPVQQLNYPMSSLRAQYSQLEKLSVGMHINKPVYRFVQDDVHYMVDAQTGELLSPLSKEQALKVAQYEYAGSGSIDSVEYIDANPPAELSSRVHSALPAWRVKFDNVGSPTLYISERTGEVLGKRHQWWRLFDWMFRFHVMDYQDSEIDNFLLFWVTLFAIFAAVMGAVLIYFTVIKNKINVQGFIPRLHKNNNIEQGRV
ncbi:PepSY domain-containing protein [Pseudoalteromonas sp. YIC-468]